MPSTPSPTATYRLQLRREFGFREAAAVVPYLAALGVSHVYCSPVLEAVPGSAHGYDVVDHSKLSPELGGDEGWAELVASCREHGLGIVVDVVPNHMAVPTPERLNRQLWDVLRLGRESPYAEWFDVDWAAQGDRLLMPVLGDRFDDCLARGEITVDAVAGVLRYFDHEFPLAPGTDSLAGDVRALHDSQHYRLAHWRIAGDELNYRRFFDVTTLIGVRVERPDVFDATHSRLLELVRAGEINGLRIDHPDGLADPGGYLDRLAAASGGAWTVVEKILEHGEVLPSSWACAGTTGYDAVTAISGALVDPAGEKPLSELYVAATGEDGDFGACVIAAKRQVVEQLFRAEISRLVRELRRPELAGVVPASVPDDELYGAIAELLVWFDVYRAYPGDQASRQRIDIAVARAADAAPHLDSTLQLLSPLLHREVDAATAFAVRFEQTTGPVMAKGVEDTAFYRYFRLAALNEVGGDPGQVGTSVEDWHRHCVRLAGEWPAAMTTLSTHDTKRSEDVRARLLVLAEIPEEWGAALARWRSATADAALDANTEYLFWQTLVATQSPDDGPIAEERLASYLEKATREAKRHTSWTDADPRYDERVADYVRRVVADTELMAEITAWVATHLQAPGRSNSLAQKLLQLTMPGVPDVYQGQELPDFSLVDPDNRRPVDYDLRRDALAALDSDRAGVDAKLRVVARTLRLRRDRSLPFTSGYSPVAATGPAADHAIAYRRGDDVLAVVTRLPAALTRRGGWQDTSLDVPDGNWQNVLTGHSVGGHTATPIADLLADLPVALLVRTDG